MEERQPLIDPQTFEVLLEVYKIVAAADTGGGQIERNDISYIAGQLSTVLKMNSMAATDPRHDPKMLDSLKKLGRNLLP